MAIWKISFNETAKTPAFYNVLPETLHNEIEGYHDLPVKLVPMFLMDETDRPEVRTKMQTLAKFFASHGMHALSIDLVGQDPVQKTISSLFFADAVTLALAKEKDVEPFSTSLIDLIKRSV